MLTDEEIAAYKADGYTYIYRSGAQLWGVKLIEGVPVWHQLPLIGQAK